MEQKYVIKDWLYALTLSDKLGLKLTINLQRTEGVFKLEKITETSEFSHNTKTVYKSNDISVIHSFLKGIEYANVL